MAAFQYTDPGRPFAGTIAELMMRRGDVEARGAEARGSATARGAEAEGAIRARQAEQQGAIVSQGLQTIGGIAAAVPGQLEEQRIHEIQKRGMQLDLAQKEKAAADLKAIDAAYAGGGGRDAIIERLPGHMRSSVLKDFEAFDKMHLESRKLLEESDRLATEAFADLGSRIKDYGYEPAAAQLALSDAKAKYSGDPARLQQIGRMEAMLHDDPTAETVQRMVDPLINLSPKRREEAQKAAELKDRTSVANVRQTEITRHNREVERISSLTEGRTEAAQKETARHNGAIESIERGNSAIAARNAGTNAAREGREQNIYNQTYGVGSKNPDGSDKAPAISPTAKLIAEYKLPPISARSAASGPGKVMMDQVAAYNPSYDGSQYATRAAMRKAFTSGSQGQQIGALNTAITHLGVLDDLATALDNGDFKPGNQAYNWIRDTFGSSAVSNFNFARDILAGELATAMKKSGATDTEIEKVSSSLKASNGAGQLRDAVRTVAIPMIGGKAKTMEEQYRQTMGEKDPFSVYTPGAKQVLETLGKGKGSAPAAPPLKSGYMRVVGPNGETGQAPEGSSLPAGWKKAAAGG